MTGQLSSQTDEDWFNFSVTAPDIINISFTQSRCTSSLFYCTPYWEVALKDSNGNILSSTIISVGTAKIDVGVSIAGKYYITVIADDYYYSSDQYVLLVSAINTSPGCTGTCSQEQLNSVYVSGYQAGVAACLANPASCGINVNPGDAVTLTSEYKMHLPNIQYKTLFGSFSIWADLEYDTSKTDASYFKVTNAGPN